MDARQNICAATRPSFKRYLTNVAFQAITKIKLRLLRVVFRDVVIKRMFEPVVAVGLLIEDHADLGLLAGLCIHLVVKPNPAILFAAGFGRLLHARIFHARFHGYPDCSLDLLRLPT